MPWPKRTNGQFKKGSERAREEGRRGGTISAGGGFAKDSTLASISGAKGGQSTNKYVRVAAPVKRYKLRILGRQIGIVTVDNEWADTIFDYFLFPNTDREGFELVERELQ